MARLPTVAGDNNNWGTVLNGYLGVEHNPDGTHANRLQQFAPKPSSGSMPPNNVGIYAIRGLNLASVMGHLEDPTFIIKAALRRGFEFVWVSDIYKALIGQGVLPEKPILLSYDDGRSQVFSVVKPVVDTYGIKCNAFITSDFTSGNPDGQVDSSLTPFAPGATWANLQTMNATGLWEFHNHTRIHNSLANQSSPTQISDLQACNSAIASNLGQTPVGLAYPFGIWSPTVVQNAVTAGLKIGFDYSATGRTRHSKLHENPWSYNRLTISANSGDAALLNHLFDPVIYSYANDFPSGRNANNQLGYWTFPALGNDSFSTADQCSITLDSRQNPGVAAVAANSDRFRVPYGASLYYHFFSETELQTLGNAWIKIKQYDVGLNALADITLKNYTTATTYTQTENETTLASNCAFVSIEVGYDSSFNGLVHYQSGVLAVVQ